MDLSIIIVTHNSRSPVEEALRSIAEHPGARETETIVIDNASTDGTVAFVRERFLGVRIVENRENVGYSRGVNQGIALSRGRMILILNPDIVVQEGSIDALAGFLERTVDAGVAAAKLLYPDGRLQYSCRAFYTLPTLLLRRTFLGRIFPRARSLRRHLMTDYDHETPRKVDWVIGACMLVRREALERVGAMDERFFLYFEDIDWCFRMQQHGWGVYFVPQSVMIHRYERSSSGSVLRKPFLIHLLSLLRYAEKWNRLFYVVKRNRETLKAFVLVLSDAIAINASFVAGYYLRDLVQPLFVRGLYPMDWYRYFILFANIIYLGAFAATGLYRERRETPWSQEFVRIARAVLIGLLILMAATYLSRIRIYSRAVVVGQAGIAVFLAAVFRRAIRAAHRELVRARFDLKRVLLVGDAREAEAYRERLSRAPDLGIDVIGRVGSDPEAVGTPAELASLVERFKAQEVVILPSFAEYDSLTPSLPALRERNIRVRAASRLAEFLGRDARVEETAGVRFFAMSDRALLGGGRALKRCFDVAVAIAALVPSALCSTACRLYGMITGRVRFSREERIGFHGRPIVWTVARRRAGGEAGDLCKFELWVSLLAGTVSLVGPPPLRASWTGAFQDLGAARPGITGRWRVAGGASREEALRGERSEMSSLSFGHDLVILLESIKPLAIGHYPPWFHGEGGTR